MAMSSSTPPTCPAQPMAQISGRISVAMRGKVFAIGSFCHATYSATQGLTEASKELMACRQSHSGEVVRLRGLHGLNCRRSSGPLSLNMTPYIDYKLTRRHPERERPECVRQFCVF